MEISSWENGKRWPPNAINQLLLQEAFGLPAEALGFEAPDNEPTVPALQAALQRGGQRYEVSDALLRYFTDQLAVHARADNATGPGFVLATTDLQLRQLESLAQRGEPEVGLMAARYAEFTGWLLQDLGDDDMALRHTDRAVELAEAFGDTTVTAYNLMRKSCVLTSLRERQRAAYAGEGTAPRGLRKTPSFSSANLLPATGL